MTQTSLSHGVPTNLSLLRYCNTVDLFLPQLGRTWPFMTGYRPSLMRPFLATFALLALVFAATSARAAEGPSDRSEVLGTGASVQANSAPDPETLLEQGRARAAWEAGQQFSSEHDVSVDMLVTMGKAAFARAKDAPLLRKKRWAKRGRDAYLAALEKDEANADALLGLATFAMRAPEGLGGGDAAFKAYKAKLLQVSTAKALVLSARAHKGSAPIEAIETYEVALTQLLERDLLSEYVTAAGEAGEASRAYRFIAKSQDMGPCSHFFAALLSEKAGLSAPERLRHLTAFAATGVQFCGRVFVADQTADKVARLRAQLAEEQGQTAHDFVALKQQS